jgi:lipopolysaccharide transport system permease protein
MSIPIEMDTPPPLETKPGTGGVSAADLPLTVIEPRPGWRLVDVGELWRYRELLFFLAWRDVKVRYKQTVLGAAWAVLQPLATMVVFSLVLGRVAAAPNATIPYPLFVFAGLLPWLFFSGALTAAAQSVVGNQSLVTKVYFPRLVIPVSAAGVSAVDFLIAFGMLLLLMMGYNVVPGWGLVIVPALLLGLTFASLGIGILLAGLTVAYRDFRYVVPFLVQLWMFATPAIYLQTDEGGGARQLLAALNPAQGYIINFRAAVLGGPLDIMSLAISTVVGLCLLVAGCLYFRRVERDFADII